MSEELLEEIRTRLKYGLGDLKHLRREILNSDDESLKDQINLLENDIKYLFEQAKRVQELTSFKNSVEYTVDSESLELIISNQNSEHVVSYSETYDEKIYLLQKRVQELEEDLLELVKQNKELRKSIAFYSSESYNAHLERLLDRSEKQIKRYREALEFYANEENYFFDEREYKVGLGVPESEITIDYGNKARKALEEGTDD